MSGSWKGRAFLDEVMHPRCGLGQVHVMRFDFTGNRMGPGLFAPFGLDGNDAGDLMHIQSGVLRPRPTPYVATYIVLRIDDRNAGRELMRRVSPVVTSAANPTSTLADTRTTHICCDVVRSRFDNLPRWFV